MCLALITEKVATEPARNEETFSTYNVLFVTMCLAGLVCFLWQCHPTCRGTYDELPPIYRRLVPHLQDSRRLRQLSALIVSCATILCFGVNGTEAEENGRTRADHVLFALSLASLIVQWFLFTLAQCECNWRFWLLDLAWFPGLGMYIAEIPWPRVFFLLQIYVDCGALFILRDSILTWKRREDDTWKAELNRRSTIHALGTIRPTEISWSLETTDRYAYEDRAVNCATYGGWFIRRVERDEPEDPDADVRMLLGRPPNLRRWKTWFIGWAEFHRTIGHAVAQHTGIVLDVALIISSYLAHSDGRAKQCDEREYQERTRIHRCTAVCQALGRSLVVPRKSPYCVRAVVTQGIECLRPRPCESWFVLLLGETIYAVVRVSDAETELYRVQKDAGNICDRPPDYLPEPWTLVWKETYAYAWTLIDTCAFLPPSHERRSKLVWEDVYKTSNSSFEVFWRSEKKLARNYRDAGQRVFTRSMSFSVPCK
jgi:hypothetical protein